MPLGPNCHGGRGGRPDLCRDRQSPAGCYSARFGVDVRAAFDDLNMKPEQETQLAVLEAWGEDAWDRLEDAGIGEQRAIHIGQNRRSLQLR
jgi:hypothetical protein